MLVYIKAHVIINILYYEVTNKKMLLQLLKFIVILHSVTVI